MNELKSKALRSYGYEGSLNDMEDAFYGGSDINTGEMNWLATLGFTQPQLNDRRKAYLTSLGFSGSLNDMLRAALVNDVYYDWGGAALSLNLAASETLDSKITFTRASSALRTNASGVLESVAINVPRIDYDPITHVCKGLLIEEARTNLVKNSNTFDNATWTKTRSSVTADSTTSPEGITNADKLVEDTLNNTHATSLASGSYAAFTSGTSYTFSVYVKAAERRGIRITFSSLAFTSNINAQFNLVNGSVVIKSAEITAGSESVGNGWWRLSITATSTTTASAPVSLFIASDDGATLSYQGDGVSGVYVYGAQVEAGAFPSSYIPTTSAAVTRSADLASVTGTDFSSWYNQSEGTFVITGDCFAKTDADSAYITVGDGTSSNFQSVIGNNGGTYQLKLDVYSGGALQASPATASNAYLQTGNAVKLAFGYKTNDICLATYLNNTTATDTSATIPTVDSAFIGAYYASGNNTLNGHISSIKYYNTKLPNEVIRMLGREL